MCPVLSIVLLQIDYYKSCKSGIHKYTLRIIASWLEKRLATVVVDGQVSHKFVLSGSIFQGTTWGPQLWNHYFADARFPIKDAGFEASVFADDLEAFRSFPRGANRQCIHTELKECQEKLHGWGKANRVIFDPTKQNLEIIHPTKHEGVPFRFLGDLFDS